MVHLGIDVASRKKGQWIAALDDELRLTTLFRYPGEPRDLAQHLEESFGPRLAVAVDAPRMPTANPTGKGGRECERELVRKTGLKVQWTPNRVQAERLEKLEWMGYGFDLFTALAELAPGAETIETFPTAVYETLAHGPELRVPFGLFSRRHKPDQLDAVACAVAAWCHARARSRVFGAGDPEGEIVIPDRQE